MLRCNCRPLTRMRCPRRSRGLPAKMKAVTNAMWSPDSKHAAFVSARDCSGYTGWSFG